MVIPIHNPSGDRELRHGERLVRLGGPLPMVGVTVLVISGGIAVNVWGLDAVPRWFFPAWVAVFSAIAQGLIWSGMHFLRRARGWSSGAVGYLWLGAAVNSLTLTYLWPYPFLLIPWLAPAIGTIAKRRLAREDARGHRHAHSGQCDT
ncbi:hypothetical protein [Streptomyces sp. ODS28]|uniref:hypothetical protein n=1 Tax=Streptomyces sp. ODS28 TaxID=3136688 RepID=UPI0031E9AE0C